MEAPRNATPLAVPTSPLALSLPSSGTRMVTSVESAIERRLPPIAPTSASTMNIQSLTLDASANSSYGVVTKMKLAIAYKTREIMLESSMTLFFGYRSTREPMKNPEKAIVKVNTPAMTDVAITDLVSRYTQKVTANHTKLLVIKATSEFNKVT